MKFDEKSFRNLLINNDKIENHYDDIIDRIEKENIVMESPKVTFKNRILDILGNKKFQVGLATSATAIIVCGVVLGVVLPTLSGPSPTPVIKTPPVFLGVSLVETNDNNTLESQQYSHFININNETNNDVQLNKDEDIIINLKFSNPDNLDISSFNVVINENEPLEFTSDSYLEGSNYTDIYVNVGKMGDSEISINVGDIYYFDGKSNLPVAINGETSITVYPKKKDDVEPDIEEFDLVLDNYEVNFTNAEFDFTLEDNSGLLSNGKVSLFSQNQLISTNDVTFNDSFKISFDALEDGQSYSFFLYADLNYNDRTLVSSQEIYNYDFTTEKYYSSIEINPSYLDVNVNIVGLNEKLSINEARVLDESNQVVKTMNNLTNNFTIDELYSNTNYKLNLVLLDESDGQIIIEENFSTLEYEAPTISIENIVVSGSRVDFRISENDVNELGQINKIELYKNEELYRSVDREVEFFTNLDMSSSYEIRVYYSYDLKDGNGPIELTATAQFETEEAIVIIDSVEYVQLINVNTSFPIHINLVNTGNLDIKSFIIDDIEYQAIEESNGSLSKYLITLPGSDVTGDKTYSITGLKYVLNGIEQTEIFDTPTQFSVSFI